MCPHFPRPRGQHGEKQCSFSDFCLHWWVRLSLDSSCCSRGNFAFNFNLLLRLCWKESPLVTIQTSVIKDDVSVSGDGTQLPTWDLVWLDERFHLVSSYRLHYKNNLLTKYLNCRYDPKTDTWTTVASLSVPRDAVGVCLLGDRLYAVGGYDGQTYLNTVESYDAQNNEWTEVINCANSHSYMLYLCILDQTVTT